jgi:hypothetical protein
MQMVSKLKTFGGCFQVFGGVVVERVYTRFERDYVMDDQGLERSNERKMEFA